MGNCLFRDEKPIRVMKTDGKILEYKSLTRVFQVLSDFSGHVISETLLVSHHLHHNTKLLSGHLYFLIPIPEKKTKKVRFSIPKETGEGGDGGVVRIKVVMSKKELREMIENGGVSEEMVSRFTSEESCRELENGGDDYELERWKPALKSIPESEDHC